MDLTTNYSLKKPSGADVVNIDDFNYNADTIDSVIKTVEESVNANKTSILSLEKQLGGQIARAKTLLTSLSSKVE